MPLSARRLEELEKQLKRVEYERSRTALKFNAISSVFTDEMNGVLGEIKLAENELQTTQKKSDSKAEEVAAAKNNLHKWQNELKKLEAKYQFNIAKAHEHSNNFTIVQILQKDVEALVEELKQLKNPDLPIDHVEDAKKFEQSAQSVLRKTHQFSKALEEDLPHSSMYETTKKAKTAFEQDLLLETLFSHTEREDFDANLIERLQILAELQTLLLAPAKEEAEKATLAAKGKPSTSPEVRESVAANKKMNATTETIKKTKDMMAKIEKLRKEVAALSSQGNKKNLAEKQGELKAVLYSANNTVVGAYPGSAALSKHPELARRWREAELKLATREEKIFNDLKRNTHSVESKAATAFSQLDERIRKLETAYSEAPTPEKKQALVEQKNVLAEEKAMLEKQLRLFREQAAVFKGYKNFVTEMAPVKATFWSSLPIIGRLFRRSVPASDQKQFMRAMADYSVVLQKTDNVINPDAISQRLSTKLATLETKLAAGRKTEEAMKAKFAGAAKDKEDYDLQLKAAEAALKAAENKSPTSTTAVIATLEQAPPVGRYRPDLRAIGPYIERLKGSLDSENISEARLLQMPANQLADAREDLIKDQSMVFYLLRAVKDNPAKLIQLTQLHQEIKTKINFITTILTKTSGTSNRTLFKSDESRRDSEIELPEHKTLDKSPRIHKPGAGG